MGGVEVELAMKALIEQAPGLAAAVIIVFLFQRHIAESAKRFNIIHERAAKAIEKNAEVAGTTNEIMREVRTLLIRMNGKDK